jgi:hypothetical protein
MKSRPLLTSLTIFWSLTCYAQQNFPGFDVIGMGYNVFGEYANSKSVQQYPLFDFSKMLHKTDAFDHSLPKYVGVHNVSEHEVKTVEGQSKKEYIENFSSGLGLSANAFFFKASIEHQLTENSTQTTDLFYYTYMDVNTKWKVTLDTRNMDTLTHYLDPQFRSDLKTLTPKELFELYGTHFIANAFLGGRIDYSTTSTVNEQMNESTVRNAVTAKFHFLQGSADMDEGNRQVLLQIATSDKLSVVGGNSEFANTISDAAQYNKWAEGIKSGPVLCGFDNKSLKPIWLLSTNAERRAELKDYYNNVLLPKYPIPAFYQKDQVLDNQEFAQNFQVYISGFAIYQDCDNYVLTGDEAGDFKYDVRIYVNGKHVKSYQTKAGYINHVWSGNVLEINESVSVSVPLKPGSNIKVWASLVESDDLRDEQLGSKAAVHHFPFATRDLYNVDLKGSLYWEESFYNSSDCNAKLYYRIVKASDPTAVDFGNKGWAEYEAGDYDQSLYYSKEALKIDNALWYIHFNVAFLYLIDGNPRAFEKYKMTTEFCADKKTIKAALDDIIKHEKKFGALANSEPVKLFLGSKI